MLILKMFLVFVFFSIFYQDVKTRYVHVLLFPAIALLAGFVHYSKTIYPVFLYNIGFNFLVTLTILGILFLYSKLVLKSPFLNHTFGLGDLLLFAALSVAFPVYTFIILFVFSILFSMVIHPLFKSGSTQPTLPLAGYMSLFFALVFLINIFFGYPKLYDI